MKLSKRKGVYLIHDITAHRFYVGSTVNLRKRINAHLFDLRWNKHSAPGLQKAFNEGNDLIFCVYCVKEGKDVNILDTEQYLLDMLFDTGLLYNVIRHAKPTGLGTKRSSETIAILKKMAIEKGWGTDAKFRAASKISNINRVHTPEEIKKWKEARAGYVHSHETKSKIGLANSIALKGRTMADDCKKKISASLMKSTEGLRHQIMADGVMYDSINDCARKTGINPGSVLYRVNKSTYKDWYKI